MRRKSLIVGLVLSALLLRALVPAGFMAAPLAEGWLFQLCPSGMSAVSFNALLGVKDDQAGQWSEHGHHAHLQDPHPQAGGVHANASHADHLNHADTEADPLCGLSAGFAAIGAAISALTDPAVVKDNARPALVLAAHPRAPPRANPVRAPPLYS